MILRERISSNQSDDFKTLTQRSHDATMTQPSQHAAPGRTDSRDFPGVQLSGFAESRSNRALLKVSHPAKAVAARWPDRVPGKQSAKINQVEPIVEILHIGFDTHLDFFPPHQLGAD
jgi:hypothetical protein